MNTLFKNFFAVILTISLLFVNFFSLTFAAVPPQGGTPNYFGPESNWSNSPLLRKFVDSLPGLGAANANNLGQYLPVATPDTITYPGSDYYEIAVRQYTEKMNSDLPPTTLRGYVQLNYGTDGTGHNTIAPDPIHYLGPTIIAQSNHPVRVKFLNELPTGTGGDLFIPVDTTVMGAGTGSLSPAGNACDPMMMPNMCSFYKQNRATLHLHGGATPWISDGTAHQWTTPASENTPYPKGVTTSNVPDMQEAGPGEMTFYYTNQQSARLMFYHDHSFGITRLNVYAGEAAGYIVQDPTESILVNGGNIGAVAVPAGTIPADQIPLIIQDKTFVSSSTVLVNDPTWNWGTGATVAGKKTPVTGDLWFPHVYMPNQNPNDVTGVNAFGRWDYGPWFWPPFTMINNGPVTLPDGTITPGVPNTSMAMESFMDTPLVNGTAYPYLDVQPKAYRFRILNAANDRYWNLQLYEAKSILSSIHMTNAGSGYTSVPAVEITDPTGNGATADATIDAVTHTVNGISLVTVGSGYTNPTIIFHGGQGSGATATTTIYSSPTEVGMVPSSSINTASGWPTPDNRVGGWPDPNSAGPSMIQIGTEGGFLPMPVTINSTPIGYDRDMRSITVGNIKEHGLFMGPAERADVIVDFSAYAGKTLILYNDSPAPVPGSDPRFDYYTLNPDLTSVGGATTTAPGYGPNTRTIMQIRVASSTPTPYVNMVALGTALPAAFAASQDPIIVPQAAYNSVYNANYPTTNYVKIADTTFVSPVGPQALSNLTLTSGGSGYITRPTVTITGGGGTGATATALNPTGVVSAFAIPDGGAGYTSAPTITLIGGGGSGYVLDPVIDPIGGQLTAVNIINGGTGYTSAPTATTTGGGATRDATLTVSITTGVITGVTLNNAGSGYTKAPSITFSAPPVVIGNSRAYAYANLANSITYPLQPKAIQELFELDYGRMNSTLGVEVQFTNGGNQTTIPLGYMDPSTENLSDSITPMSPIAGDGTQLWKITHNGVDTHAIHFHLFNVQLVNRVDWAGVVKPPEPNELGWKETVRMNPLEDAIVALRPVAPKSPFGVLDSVRPLDVTMPIGSTMGFSAQDANGNPVTTVNAMTNFGWEYVWHCHLLGHEEMDMMRPMDLKVISTIPPKPTNVSAALAGSSVVLTWRDTMIRYANPANRVGYRIERARLTNGNPGTYAAVGLETTQSISYIDVTGAPSVSYDYRVVSYNAAGTNASNPVQITIPGVATLASPSSLTAAAVRAGTRDTITLDWIDNSNGAATGFTIQRATNSGFTAGLATYNIPANTTFQIANIARGRTYWFRIRATATGATSVWSNIAIVVTP